MHSQLHASLDTGSSRAWPHTYLYGFDNQSHKHAQEGPKALVSRGSQNLNVLELIVHYVVLPLVEHEIAVSRVRVPVGRLA